MKLRRFLLRYYPPGIILEYEQGGELRNKPVDLLTLTPESDLEVLVNQVVRQEALISENRKPQLRKLLYALPAPPALPAPQPRSRATLPALQPCPPCHSCPPCSPCHSSSLRALSPGTSSSRRSNRTRTRTSTCSRS
jgi:hypothetical protein